MASHHIADEEVLYLRIPPGSDWFQPPDRITTANYKLDTRKDELGLSVYRASVVSANSVLARPDAIPDSFLVSATIGDIRGLKNGIGDPLNLDVIPVNDAHDPGHAEIRGPKPGRLTKSTSKALRDLFQRIPE